MTVRQVIRKFFETTTIRGIGRAVKAESKFLFVVWMLSVTCCSSALFYQIFLVLSRYFRYDYQIVDREAQTMPDFPDITFCNFVNPLGSSLENKTWEDYQAYMRDQETRWTYEQLSSGIQDLSNSNYDQLWVDLMSPSAYYANFPFLMDTTLNKSNKSAQNTIVDINVYDWSLTYIIIATEYSSENIQLTWNPSYHHCYTLQIPEKQSQAVRAMSFIVYLDDFNSFVVDKVDANPSRSMSTGIRLAIHGRGTKPDFNTGISAGPGAEKFITVTQVSRQHLDDPYNGCNEDKQYSSTDCVDECLQDKIIKECSCVSSDLSFKTEQFKSVNYTVCINQTWLEYNKTNTNRSSDELKVLRRLHCTYNVQLDAETCINQCAPPCTEEGYSATNSDSKPWPHASNQLAFYKKFIDGTDYADRFAEYAVINSNMTQGDISVVEALAQLRKLDLIERNFLQVNVMIENYVYTTLKEVPTMPSEVLLSNIGGVLSLWLGVTVMTVVEITEFIYFIFVACYDRCRKKTEPINEN